MYKRHLLSAASVAALASFGLATPSLAFNTVEWDWNLGVKTHIHLDIYEWIEVDPKGATIVEIEQDFKGDAYATANMNGVDVDWTHKGPDDVTVVNSAAALGNAVSIETETSAQVHVDQDVDGEYSSYRDKWGHIHYTYDPAYFSADATMRNVYVDAQGDAEVTNSAAAIANSFSLTVDPLCGDKCEYVGVDSMLAIVDLTQDAEADLFATASMYNVDVDAWGNVDVTNAAVAAGNVANITVVRGAIPFPDQD